MKNWAENFEFEAADLRRPATVEELRRIVGSADRVKAVGTRHSFTRVADSPRGTLVSLDRIEPRLTIDPEAMTATVTGGTSYGVLAAALEAQGFALANLASLPQISVAGGTATATHGSGDHNQILSAAVAAVELVGPEGDLTTVDRDHPDLPAVAVGLGAFGVIATVTLDIEPSYLVRQDLYVGPPWEAVLDNFDEVMASAYSVNLHADFADPAMRVVWQKSRVDVDRDGRPEIVDFEPERWGGRWHDGGEARADGSRAELGGVPGPWSERMAHFTMLGEPSAGGDELQSDYFVGREHAVDAINALRAMGHRISPHLHGTEIRTVAADDLWISPAYQRPSVSIGFTWRKHPEEVAALIPEIEDALAAFAVRPHWGKWFSIPHTELVARLPRLHDFLALARGYDPEGKFSNPFLASLRGDSGAYGTIAT